MSLMPVQDALAAVLNGALALPSELVALDDAYRRVLAHDVAALRTQPPAAMSAMDGYAVRSADAQAGARLTVTGEIAAGRPFTGSVGAGEAVRIFTGGVMPVGADAVVIQEDATRDGEVVIINEAARLGRHIRLAGVDFRSGDVLLPAGRRLSARDLSLAAGMNHPALPVVRRPKVALLATGDELVMPGADPAPGQIVYSNGYALRAMMRAEGAEVVDLGVAADTMEATTACIRQARAAAVEVLVTIGGASVGDHDLIKPALAREGAALDFWKIAMRPGKPMLHGRLDSLRVLGLPGNPVSSFVCAFLFLVPLIRALTGRQDIDHRRETAILGDGLPANDQREDYLRAALDQDERGLWIATPVQRQDSSLLSQLSVADAVIVRPPHAPASVRGDGCTIIRLPR
jgi:molybdopterin molybdotransferase